MKRTANSSAIKAFTLVELLLVVSVIWILAGLLLHAGSGRSKPNAVKCADYLRKLGGGFNAWAQDHEGLLPMEVSSTNGGSKDLILSNSAAVHFLTLTNSKLEVVYEHRIYSNRNGRDFYITRLNTNYGIRLDRLICPSDEQRDCLIDGKSLADTNISYFVGVDASLRNPKSILAGDRNLRVNGELVKPGLLTLPTNADVSWDTNRLHSAMQGGNILFGDGHVEFVKKPAKVFGDTGQSAQRLAIP